jgi:hypothetical protein
MRVRMGESGRRRGGGGGKEECVTEWSRGRRSLPLCVNMQLLLQSTDLTTAFFSNTISVAGNCVRAAAAAAEAAAAAMRYGGLEREEEEAHDRREGGKRQVVNRMSVLVEAVA